MMIACRGGVRGEPATTRAAGRSGSGGRSWTGPSRRPPRSLRSWRPTSGRGPTGSGSSATGGGSRWAGGCCARCWGGRSASHRRRSRFAYGTRGKPALARPGDSGLEFNLSHSNGLALLATSWGRAVGIDLEYQGKELDFLGIADRFFTPQELGQIRGQPEAATQRSAFFRGWARKEAFLKARGDGLWVGLDQFEVSIDPAAPARVVWTAWDPDEAGRWTLLDLDVAPGFAAALVVEGAVSGPIVVETF